MDNFFTHDDDKTKERFVFNVIDALSVPTMCCKFIPLRVMREVEMNERTESKLK